MFSFSNFECIAFEFRHSFSLFSDSFKPIISLSCCFGNGKAQQCYAMYYNRKLDAIKFLASLENPL